MSSTILRWTAHTWLPLLLGHEGTAARHRLREVLLGHHPDGGALAQAWKGAPDLLDRDTVEALLDRLGPILARVSDTDAPRSNVDELRNGRAVLELLADGRLSPEQHGSFVARRGSALNRQLVRFARHRLSLRTSLDRDHDYEHAKRLLARIGGRSHEELVLTCLRHDNRLVRKEGTRDALRAGTEEIMACLWSLAEGLGRSDDNDAVSVAVDAWRALFALDSDTARARVDALLLRPTTVSAVRDSGSPRSSGRDVPAGGRGRPRRGRAGLTSEVIALRAAYHLVHDQGSCCASGGRSWHW